MFCMFLPHVCLKYRYPLLHSWCQQSHFYLDCVPLLNERVCASCCTLFSLPQTYLIWHFFGFHKYTQLGWLFIFGSSLELSHPFLLTLWVNFSQGLEEDTWEVISYAALQWHLVFSIITLIAVMLLLENFEDLNKCLERKNITSAILCAFITYLEKSQASL